MVKRIRNKFGQFISGNLMAKNSALSSEAIIHNAFSIFMALVLFFLVCPWVTIIIKSKTIKSWIFSIISFCDNHFVGIDEYNEANGTYKDKKDPNDL